MRRLLILLTTVVLANCSRGPSPERFQGPTMGTTYSVVVTQLPPGVARESLQVVIDEVLSDANTRHSTYDSASEVSRFNDNTGTEWVAVSLLLFDVVAIAYEVSRATAGAFDITVGPLVRRWGFGGGSDDAQGPDSAEIAQLRESVGYEKLELQREGPSIRKVLFPRQRRSEP